MKQRYASTILAVFLISLCIGCKTESLIKYTCLWEAGDTMTLASGGGELACDEVLLFYNVENDRILSNAAADTDHTLYLSSDTGNSFPQGFFWNNFTEAEISQIQSEGLLQRHFGLSGYKLTLPVISLNNPGHAFVLTSFCTYSDEGLIIENPVSGKPALIQDIEYVKFKNAPLIQLPVGNEEGTGVITG